MQKCVLGFLPMGIETNILDLHPYLRQTLDLIADKWVVAVLYVLSQDTRRYGELQKEIDSISQRMLTRTLRDLERNGLVSRKVYLGVPSMVEYSLTPLGKTLNQVLKELCDWSNENFRDVEAAMRNYDNLEQNRR
jgi:DNA-binding HxlR family transcriptional regulator